MLPNHQDPPPAPVGQKPRTFAKPKKYDPQLAFRAHQDQARRVQLLRAAEDIEVRQRKNMLSELGFSDSSDDDGDIDADIHDRFATRLPSSRSCLGCGERINSATGNCNCGNINNRNTNNGTDAHGQEMDNNQDEEQDDDQDVVLKEEYDQLQQRYLTALKGVHEVGERERELLSNYERLERRSAMRMTMVRKGFMTRLSEQAHAMQDMQSVLRAADAKDQGSRGATFEAVIRKVMDDIEGFKNAEPVAATDTDTSAESPIVTSLRSENDLLRTSVADLASGRVPLHVPQVVGIDTPETNGVSAQHTADVSTSGSDATVTRAKLAKAVKVAKIAKARLAQSEKEKESLMALLTEAQVALGNPGPGVHEFASESKAGEQDITESISAQTDVLAGIPTAKLSDKVKAKFNKLKAKLIESEAERKKAVALVRDMAEQMKNTDGSDGSTGLTPVPTSAQHEQEHQQLSAMTEQQGKKLHKYKAMAHKLKTKYQGSVKVLHDIRARVHDERNSVNELRSNVVSELEFMQKAQAQLGRELKKAVKERINTVGSIMTKYERELKERKRLFNLVQELRGNIRVLCRVRPTLEFEGGAKAQLATSFPDQDSVGLVNSKGRTKVWEFDKVLGPALNNAEIFKEVEDLCVSALDGYNVCIFAYGQTGSGKTYTMEGPTNDRGVNHRALAKLFTDMKQRSNDGEWTFSTHVSFLEIYNEQIRDLMTSKSDTRKLEVKQGENGMHVPGLTMVPVETHEQVAALIKAGHKNRATAFTNMNEHSSRSHSMLSTYLTAHNNVTGQTSRGKLHLIDLAGSERLNRSGAQGQRMTEAQNINKSLSALGDVIQSRANKASHVPFRNSTLTYLLQDSLSKDSKTVMFVQISPVEANAEESFCSLNFAARARKVELGKAVKHAT